MFSVTQGTNIASITASVSIIIKIVGGGEVTPEEWQIVGIAVVTLISSVVSFINRKAKGDVTMLGVKKDV